MEHSVESTVLICCWKVRVFGYMDLAFMWEKTADAPLLFFISGEIRFIGFTLLQDLFLSLAT